MIILHDGNPLSRIRRAWVNQVIVVVCMVMFVLQLFDAFSWQPLAFYPHQLWTWSDRPGPFHGLAGLITHMFFHGDPLHLASNLLALLVFGNNLEDALGHRRYLLFYLLSGVAAAVVQGTLGSSTIPLIGASGAISAVMGAYLLLHPRARILILAFNIAPVMAPASLVVGFTILVNVAMAYDVSLLSGSEPSADLTRIAWWAHIGGFASGLLFLLALKPRDVPLFQSPPPLPARTMRWLGRFVPTLAWPGERPIEEPGADSVVVLARQNRPLVAKLMFIAKALIYVLLIFVLMRYLG